MNRLIGVILAGILAVSTYTIVAADNTPTPTPEPVAKLQFAKSGQLSDNVIIWTVSIINSGNADSGSQTIQDILPAGVYWSVASVTGLDCTLSPYIVDLTRQILTCNTVTIPKAYFDEGKFAIINGHANVVIYGYAEKCGLYRNIAVRNNLDVITATVDIPCPTPTPTATMTPTATPSPTVIPATNTPTPVPTIIPATSTPTTVFIPKPPNTGNTSSSTPETAYDIILVGSVLMLIGLGVTFYTERKRRR